MNRIVGYRKNQKRELVPHISDIILDSIPKVGIFYFINDGILFDAVPAVNGEPYGEAVQHGSHYEFWDSLGPKTSTEKKFKSRVYDAYPRGRVVYFSKRNTYRIYNDICINFSVDIPFVMDTFGLKDVEVEFEYEEYYQCSKCNPDFMD